ncbi:head GIN domain-containing protein [Polaribacter sp.]|uniref:head GIN domain-containing protein n=1 Tax=Polaribacter sp. TaxID=1920175 RepID=UPI003F6A969D
MKTTIHQILTVLFITTLFTSCSVDMFNRVNGNRNVISKQRTLAADFTGISVSNGIDLYISQDNKTAISVEADENLHEIIITEVDNGILKIYTEKNIWQSKARKVYVTVNQLTSLKASSGSDVYGEDIIKTEEIAISSSSGADINIEIEAESVATSASSGSDIEVSGTATNHASNAASGSSINAYNLKSKNVIVSAASGADIDIFASEKIEARASSGGDVDFKGNPKKVSKKSSSGGSISQK